MTPIIFLRPFISIFPLLSVESSFRRLFMKGIDNVAFSEHLRYYTSTHFGAFFSPLYHVTRDSIHKIVTYETVLFPSSISLPLISGGETRIHPYKDRNAIANTKYLFNALFIFFSFGENTRNIRIIDNQYRIKIQHARRFRFRQIHIYIDGWRRDEAERSF